MLRSRSNRINNTRYEISPLIAVVSRAWENKHMYDTSQFLMSEKNVN